MAGDKGLFRYGFERSEGVPGTTSVFSRFSSETFNMSRPYEPDPNLDPSGNETEGEGLKAEGTGSLVSAPNSENLLQMRIHQHEFYDKTTPAAGVERWELRDYDELVDDPIDHYVGSLFFGVWRDERADPSEYNGMGLKVNEFTLSVDANKFVQYEHAGLFLRDRYMRLPYPQAVDPDYTGSWALRGHRRVDDEDGPFITFKASTAGALGVAKIVYGSGANLASLTSVGLLATATTAVPHGFTTGDTVTIAGSTVAAYNGDFVITVTGTYTFTYAFAGGASPATTASVITATMYADVPTEYLVTDTWMDVRRADDSLAGTSREPIQIRPLFGGTLTIDDEWRIYPTSPKPVPTFSDRPKLSGTDLELRFSLNGGTTWITKVIDQFSLKMGTPREAKFALGSKYAQEIGKPDNSKKWWEASFNRTYVDRDFAKALTGGRTISAYAKFIGGPIGSTGYDDFAEFTLDRMHLSQAGATVTSPGDLKENPVLRAFSENGSTLCTEVYQNTIADVHPT